MIMLAGIIMVIIALNNGDRTLGVVGSAMAVIGFIVLVLSAGAERNKARNNMIRYWAYGEEPDWKRRRRYS